MAIQRNIEIDGREVPFKASAALTRMYRARFGRDIIKDFDRILAEMDGEDPDLSTLSVESLERFEDIAYTMAKYADPAVPETVEAWLEGFNTFSIYFVLPLLADMWGLNVQTEAEAKKNLSQATAL